MKELDVVLLKDGRKATILEDYGEYYMVEVTDPKGRTLETPMIDRSEIEKVIWEYKA